MNLTLPRYGDLVEVVPTELDDDGLAVCRLDWPPDAPPGAPTRRMKLIVRGAMPGDRVVFRAESRTRETVYGRMIALLEPAPARVEPTCRHARYAPEARSCGGCTLQALAYPAQLELKRARVAKAFDVAGVRLDVLAPRPAPAVFGHRHKMELSFASDPMGPNPDAVALGLHPPGLKWEVLALAECPLLSPELSRFLPTLGAIFARSGLRGWDPRHERGFLRNLILREGQRTGDRLLELQTTTFEPEPDGAAATVDRLKNEILDHAHQSGLSFSSILWTVLVSERGRPNEHRTTVLHGRPTMTERLQLPGGRELTFEIDPRAFFQPHPKAAEGLIAEVVQRLGHARTVLDLYCGTGTLGLALAPFVDRVVGIELVAEAVASATLNAAHNGLENTRFIAGDVGATLAAMLGASELVDVDAVVLDPPRGGLMPGALEALVALRPPRVVYISCKPESLGRDLRALAAAGFEPEGPAQPFDLFPQSHHVETLVVLRGPGAA